MTSRERVHAAMAGQPVDQIPIFPVTTRNLGARALGVKVGEMVLNPHLTFDGMRAMKRRFNFDGLECVFAPPHDAKPAELISRNGVMYLIGEDGEPYAEYQADDDPINLDRSPWLKEKKDLEKVTITTASSLRENGQLDDIIKLRQEMGDDLFLVGCAASQTMNSLAGWRGSEQGLYDLIDDPQFVHELMDIATEISIEQGKAYIDAGVDAIYIGDAWSSASIISPQQFEKFCLPRYTRVTEIFHQLGVQVYLHICGNAVPLFEMIADTGVDCIEPLDPLGGVSVADVVRRVGDRISLKGGVNTLTLLNGSPDEVRAETRMVLDAAVGKCRGFILGSGDDIPRDTPFENIDAMIETAQQYN